MIRRGMLAAHLAAIMGTVAMVGGLPVPQAYAQAASVSYAIPGGSLSAALTRWARASGITLLAAADVLNGHTTSGLSGSYLPQDALETLLAGTGLRYAFNGATVTVSRTGGAAGDSAQLAPDGSVQLETINVSGQGGAQAAADAPFQTPGTSAHISAEQIQRVPPSSLGDMFKGTPGVFSTGNRNGAALNVNIRGLQGQNRIKTSIDGAMQQSSVYRGYNGHDSRMYVDPEFIAGIDIEKGPGGSAGAMGGSVNMRTLRADDIVEDGKTFGARFRGGLGGNRIAPVTGMGIFESLRNNPPLKIGRTGDGNVFSEENYFGSAVVAAKTDAIEVLAGISRRVSGNYFAGTQGEEMAVEGGTTIRHRFAVYGYGEEIFNTSEASDSAIAKVRFRPHEDHTFDLGYVYHDSAYGEDMGDLFFVPGVPGSYQKRQASLKGVRADTYTARYAWQPDSDFFDLRANLWATNVDSKGGGGRGLNMQAFTWGGELHNTSVAELPFGSFKIRYGADYYTEDLTYQGYVPGAFGNDADGIRSMASGFVNAELMVMDTVRFDLGFRHDRFDVTDKGGASGIAPKSGSKTNPSFGITLIPVEGVQLFAKYAEGWRPPSVRESLLNMDSLLAPNPDLRPEQSRNSEIGINISRNGLLRENDRLRLKAAYFDNDYIDFIGRSYFGGPRGFRNIPGVKMKGFEVSGSYDAGFAFVDGSLNYYTSVEYCLPNCVPEVSGDDYSSYHIPPKFSGTLAAGVRLFDERLTLGGRATFAGERAINGAGGGFGAVLARYWHPYQVYDLFGSYAFNDKLKLDFSVENVTDLYYLDALSDAKIPSPGRTFRASLTAKF